MHVREVRFDGINNTGEILRDRDGFNMVGHEDDVEAESVQGWVERQVMKLAER